MSLAVAHSRAQAGVHAPPVTVEVHLSNGLPGLTIVGLPEAEVRESKDRVRSALINSGFEFPQRRITISLAPADLPKEGTRFDLPIALGILAASGQTPQGPLGTLECIGELALSGELRPVHGVLPAALQARTAQRALIVPPGNAAEAALVSGIDVYPARHLLDVCAHLSGVRPLQAQVPSQPEAAEPAGSNLGDVRGQRHARRALEISAAGGHSLLLIGPPGTGKTMLASRLPGILPPLTESEALETAAVYSVAGRTVDAARWRIRPFRSPHHTASAVALVGGGSQPRPGEISLAHHGVLFLDELPEFERRVLEVLREPLESGRVTISRAARQAEFPAQFQLVAAMNPCPCGYLGEPEGRCHCTAEQVQRYRARVSGPLLDRIDMHVEVPRVPYAELLAHRADTEDSAVVRSRVIQARSLQQRRAGALNHALDSLAVEQSCMPDSAGRNLLEQAMERLGLSARAYHRVLRVARSIADLTGSRGVKQAHIAEAVGYRCLDRRPP